MDPLITDGVDPALVRVFEKRGHDRDPGLRRRRPAPPEKPPARKKRSRSRNWKIRSTRWTIWLEARRGPLGKLDGTIRPA